MATELEVCKLMFYKKRIVELEGKVKGLECIVRRMHNYLQPTPSVIEFSPDPELTKEIRNKMN